MSENFFCLFNRLRWITPCGYIHLLLNCAQAKMIRQKDGFRKESVHSTFDLCALYIKRNQLTETVINTEQKINDVSHIKKFLYFRLYCKAQLAWKSG